MKNIVVFPSCKRFQVKAISCVAFGLSSACCLLKSIAINL